MAPERPPQPEPDDQRPRSRSAERAAARARIEQQQTWVDLQLRKAREEGAFDDLPGYGKPLSGLGENQDPDWWVKQLIERERIVVVPPALQLRRDDDALDEELDRLGSEAAVRATVQEFNQRVRRVLYSTTGWPPVVTSPRDEDAEVERWRERRRAGRDDARRTGGSAGAAGPARRWSLRRRRGGRDHGA